MVLCYAETTLALRGTPCLHRLNVGPVAPPQRFAYLTFAAAWNRWMREHCSRPSSN